MAVGPFLTGRDVSINITLPGGAALVIPAGAITSFKAEQQTTELKSKGMDGTSRFGIIPDSWKGTIKMDRFSSSVDDYFAAAEAAYYAGQNSLSGVILETITELNGSTTQYQYDGVVLKYDEAGEWAGDKKVDISVSFMASHRIKIQ